MEQVEMTYPIDVHDIESASLPAHVSICQERYKQLDSRINGIEQHLVKIDEMLVEIRDTITVDRQDQFKMFLTWAGVIITTLIGSCGYLIAHYVIK